MTVEEIITRNIELAIHHRGRNMADVVASADVRTWPPQNIEEICRIADVLGLTPEQHGALYRMVTQV